MRTLTTTLLISAWLASTASAQELKLPALSPKAMTMQTVGITEMTVTYSSPGVRGRKAFGEVVSFDKLWRTGANAPTKFKTTTEVVIGGKTLPAGEYSILSIPGKKMWTVIFNTDPNARTRNYDKAKDAVRVKVNAQKIAARERLAFMFVNTTADGTRLDLEWATTRISVDIKVPTTDLSKKGIEAYNKSAARRLANAARYHADTHKDLDTAMLYIDRALALDGSWFINWIKADMMARKGDYKGAYPYAQKAWELGNKDDYFFWKDRVKKALDEWKGK